MLLQQGHPNATLQADVPRQQLRPGKYVAKLAPGEEPSAIPLLPGPDIPQAEAQLIVKASTRWLKGQELHSLLQLCKDGRFPYSMTAATRPPGGTLFLYDRKVVRFFRLDGHNWRKKNDNKTVRETHEKLKLDNVDAINCYYAHAIEPPTLQRRCYWLLDSDNYVLVHYLQTMANDNGTKQGQIWPDQLLQHQAQYMTVNQSLNVGLGVPLSLAPFNVLAASGAAQPQQQMVGLSELQQMSLMTEQMMRDHKRHAAIHAAIHQRAPPDSVASTIWGQGGFQSSQLPWEATNDSFNLAQTSMGVPAATPHWDSLSLSGLSVPPKWWEHDSSNQIKTDPKTAENGATSAAQPLQMLTACYGRHSPDIQPQKVSRTSFEAPSSHRPPVEASIGTPWFNVLEVNPEIVTPDGGTKVVIIGSPTPGFELNRELFIDVGGQKIPATVTQAGMLSFNTPQRNPGHVQIMITDASGRALSSSAVLKFQYPRRASCSDAARPPIESGRISQFRGSTLAGHPEIEECHGMQQMDFVRGLLTSKQPHSGLGKQQSENVAIFDEVQEQ